MSYLWWTTIIVFLLSNSTCLLAHDGNDSAITKKTVKAVKIHSEPPKVDGILDDPIWQEAPIFTGFIQRRPDQGQPVSELTAVQFAYDDKALYVGIMAYDRNPEQIVTRLARRDQWTEADFVQVVVDAHHDHQTNFVFQVYAGGSLLDGYNYNDGSGWDGTWDGVWEARQSQTKEGWSIEYRIPYHVLRFSPGEKYTWGINMIRYISRRKEDAHWVLVPLGERGWPSRFAHLEGIEKISPPKSLEILPYTVGRSTFISGPAADSRDFFSNLGVDMHYGLTSGTSLNATVNPDFGQVEADPAVLNLSVFETFQEERRPFFVEGAQNFQTPIQLFYSRRIGKQPGYRSIPDGFQMTDRPDFTTILGAAKITGKTTGKTTFGVMEAFTANEYAAIESTYTDLNTGEERVKRRDFLIEPWTHFLVGQVKQDLLKGNSHVGVIGTSLNRHGAEDAYSSGLDWNLKWGNNDYDFWGQVAGSQAGLETDRKNGFGNEMAVGKRSGWLQGELKWEVYSKDFEINDLGFQWRNNYYESRLQIQFRKDKPWGISRRNSLSINRWGRWNFDEVNLANGIGLSTWNQLKNYWEIYGELTHQFRAKDDLDTRGGPLIVRPASTEYDLFVESDDRLAVSGWLDFSWGSNTAGSTWRTLSSRITVKPVSYLELQFQPRYRWNFSDAQWVRNVDADNDGTINHFVYGELNSKTLDLTTRFNVIFSPDLSMEFYMQPFLAVGNYKSFKELAQPDTYAFIPYNELGYNPDFRRRSLQSNMVVRWEYRPGSTFFFVWSQSRSKRSSDPSFHPMNDLLDSFSDSGSNIFFVKASYWLAL